MRCPSLLRTNPPKRKTPEIDAARGEATVSQVRQIVRTRGGDGASAWRIEAQGFEFRQWSERSAERDQLRQQIAALRTELGKETEVRDMLAMLVRAEQEDVRALEQPSLKRFTIRLRGELDETLGREIIEVEEARRSHAARVRDVGVLQARLRECAERPEAPGDVDAGYADALAQRAAVLAESVSQLRIRVGNALEELAAVYAARASEYEGLRAEYETLVRVS